MVLGSKNSDQGSSGSLELNVPGIVDGPTIDRCLSGGVILWKVNRYGSSLEISSTPDE
jgi:hypothetical protein